MANITSNITTACERCPLSASSVDCSVAALEESYGPEFRCTLRADNTSLNVMPVAFFSLMWVTLALFFAWLLAYCLPRRCCRSPLARLIGEVAAYKFCVLLINYYFYSSCDFSTGVCKLWLSLVSVLASVLFESVFLRLLLLVSIGYCTLVHDLTLTQAQRISTRVVAFGFSYQCHYLFGSWFSLLLLCVMSLVVGDIFRNLTMSMSSQHTLLNLLSSAGIDPKQTPPYKRFALFRKFTYVLGIFTALYCFNTLMGLIASVRWLSLIIHDVMELVILAFCWRFCQPRQFYYVPVVLESRDDTRRTVYAEVDRLHLFTGITPWGDEPLPADAIVVPEEEEADSDDDSDDSDEGEEDHGEDDAAAGDEQAGEGGEEQAEAAADAGAPVSVSKLPVGCVLPDGGLSLATAIRRKPRGPTQESDEHWVMELSLWEAAPAARARVEEKKAAAAAAAASSTAEGSSADDYPSAGVIAVREAESTPATRADMESML